MSARATFKPRVSTEVYIYIVLSIEPGRYDEEEGLLKQGKASRKQQGHPAASNLDRFNQAAGLDAACIIHMQVVCISKFQGGWPCLPLSPRPFPIVRSGREKV